MITNFILTSCAIAGAAVVWRSFLYDFKWLREGIKSHTPIYIGKMLTCGTCFTYWLTLLVVIIFDPLAGWLPTQRVQLGGEVAVLLQIVFSWMAIALIATLLRFGYAAISELVHYQVHKLNHREH